MKSIYYDPDLQQGDKDRKWFENVKLIGEIDEGTSIYIEDYAYTYLHQYANSELSDELCAVLVGKYYEQCNQVEIYGVMPVKMEWIACDSKWIDKEALDIIDEERKRYFPEGEYVGWMHTQPGYGIMSTTQELAVHKEVFGQLGVLMLVDPVYHGEVFFTYNDNLLREKKGFCIYYEKNELMQKYMEDHSLVEEKEQQPNDKVVEDFRQLGMRWKKEVERKMKRNKIAMAVGGFLLVAVLITGVYNQQRKSKRLEKDVVNIYDEYSQVESEGLDDRVEVIFTAAPSEPDPGYNIHVVEIGDSLQSISFDYYETVEMVKEIAKLNNIVDCDTIYIGQELKLPRR